MSDIDASAGFVVSIVVMTPLMLLAALAIRQSKPVTRSNLRIHISATAMIIMGIVLIGFFLLQILF